MDNLVTFSVLGLYGLLLFLDLVRPARSFPEVRFWRLKGIGFFVLYATLATVAPLLWDEWLGAHRLVDLTGLGHGFGALVGYLVLATGIYAWHRALHAVPWLFRWFHQMHHSAERIGIWGAFYFSPLDMIGFTFVGSFCLVFLVGLTPEAAILANGIATFMGYFQHANVRTPHWLGYLIQRPEQHAIHHERGVHAYNYGDLPFTDMLFGTFRNPAKWEGVGGYYDGASARVGDMLLGRDVTFPVEAPSALSGRSDGASTPSVSEDGVASNRPATTPERISDVPARV